MTPDQKRLVRATFEQIRPVALEAGELFYSRLFELYPDLRPLFKGDVQTQALKLMALLQVAVACLDQPALLAPLVARLGARHTIYGVKAEHYCAVGASMLWTLEATLGPVFTPQAREAWTLAYKLLASAMQKASVDRV